MLTVMLHLIVAGLCLFLVGANISFVAHLRSRVVPWFSFKISAVTLLLLYVASSVFLGHPTLWRLVLGFIATTLDTVALYRMWFSIAHMENEKIVGLVPLIKPREEPHAQ